MPDPRKALLHPAELTNRGADGPGPSSPARYGGRIAPDPARLVELSSLLERHVRPDWSTLVDGVHISRVEDEEPPISPDGPMFAVIAQGAKTIALADCVYEYRAGRYLISPLDLPTTGHYIGASRERPALGFGLTLEAAAIADLLLTADHDDIPRDDGRTPRGLIVSDMTEDLLDPVIRLVRLLDRPQDIRTLAPLIVREILWRLITGEQGALVRQFVYPDSNLSYIARAIQWIRENYTEPFRVEELARMSGMSTSSFHRHFQAVTAMSPLQFQKRIRLGEARLLLAAQPSDVTGVSFRVGYNSPAQFSREYRRLFGAPPSEDAANLQAYRRNGSRGA
jgi:AraC-like DNA-binding protein